MPAGHGGDFRIAAMQVFSRRMIAIGMPTLLLATHIIAAPVAVMGLLAFIGVMSALTFHGLVKDIYENKAVNSQIKSNNKHPKRDPVTGTFSHLAFDTLFP